MGTSTLLPLDPTTRLVLASGSPRRRDLLGRCGVTFVVRPADLDESVLAGETPVEHVTRLARAKALAVADTDPDGLVLAADTTVDLGGAILGKPVDDGEATAMLRRLSGRTHAVHTAVAVATAGTLDLVVVTTAVTFDVLGPDIVEWYVATGEPFGKAGAYAIQGAGAVLVQTIDGSASNVIGLPMAETVALLRRAAGGRR